MPQNWINGIMKKGWLMQTGKDIDGKIGKNTLTKMLK